MRSQLQALGLAAAAALTGIAPAAAAGHRSTDPVVVELYTAQGCSTCPKADPIVGALAGPGVVTLTFSVDYWDYLGWADTLAKPEFAARQRAFARRLKVREIYTPEIVVEGQAEGSALNRDAIQRLVDDAKRRRRASPVVQIARRGGRVRISERGSPVRSDVWLVRYDPSPTAVKVKAGENKGRVVVVQNAVLELKRLGGLSEGARSFVLPAPVKPGLKTVIIVQAQRGGRIVGSARL